jgi:hypothetical protein
MINPDPVAMVKGAEHRELAQKFIEFVLSRRGQLLWNTRANPNGPGPKSTNLRRLPIAPGVYSDLTNFTDKVNPYAASGKFNKSNDREQTFRILGELIEASCMNCLDELRETRKEILASPRAAELDARLGKFPFGQAEALKRSAEYKIATPVKQQAIIRRWTGEFEAEYRQLREEANRK